MVRVYWLGGVRVGGLEGERKVIIGKYTKGEGMWRYVGVSACGFVCIFAPRNKKANCMWVLSTSILIVVAFYWGRFSILPRSRPVAGG